MEKSPFQSVLIANRGEIACRIIRSAKELGLRTIAVYSEADTHAPHVKMADNAFELGPAPAAQSYLAVDRILAAIEHTGAEAVHPGYGFLSENAAFAEMCRKKGIVFIGPNTDAIEIMGDKAKAKRRMIAANVPCIPGYQGEDQSDDILIKQSIHIGFPLMVKAAAGGGGRGMRLVQSAEALPNSIKLARSEAENAFGSGELILERAIIEPRHVEIQIFADKFGNVIHLGERDCSVQRRHQKVIEEAPCPVMTPELRDAMGAAAVNAARDVNYVGAGTVEFLLAQSGEFYFLEMNTRLQVEHPVTEMVTGLDLVAWQIRVAQGQSLPLTQMDVTLEGHAIEARLYAEDTTQDFLPATGPVDFWCPAKGNGVRIDAGIQTGGLVSPFYDPMIAKVVAYGLTREEARVKLIKTMEETALFGVTNNRSFLIDALQRSQFADGKATTGFIASNFGEADLAAIPLTARDGAIGALLLFLHARKRAVTHANGMPDDLLNWTSASPITTPYLFDTHDGELEVALTPGAGGCYQAVTPETRITLSTFEISTQRAKLLVDGTHIEVLFNIPPSDPSGQTLQFSIGGRSFVVTNLNGVTASQQNNGGAGAVIAPMHGLLHEIFVKPGDKVTRGEKLATLEAMKMQHELRAEIDGTITEVPYTAGVQVSADALLMVITADE